VRTTDEIVSVSFDRFPSAKGAATHIDAFARALGREFGNVRLVTIPPLPDAVTGKTPVWEAPGVTHCPLSAEGPALFERVIAYRSQVWNWWKREFGSQNRRPRVAHVRSIYEGYPIASRKSEFCEQLIYEVNGLPSVELKYHYPNVADDRELLHKLRSQEQACLTAADLIVTVSQVNLRHLVSRGADPEKICVIPNGVDLDQFPYQTPRSSARTTTAGDEGTQTDRGDGDEQPVRMLYVGTLSAWQGVTQAIEALALYQRDWPATLTVAGPVRNRERKSLEKLAWNQRVFEAIHLTGPVSKDELAGLYHDAHVVVAPLTRNDRNCDQGCCPLKVLEALAAGTPLIASDLEVVRELCRNDEHAMLVRPGSGKSIKDAMLRLRSDPALGLRLSQAGRCHVEQRFGWDAAQQALIGAYTDLMNRPSST
jgi:glycosyltransferase involved in cell wall biosynthesis